MTLSSPIFYKHCLTKLHFSMTDKTHKEGSERKRAEKDLKDGSQDSQDSQDSEEEVTQSLPEESLKEEAPSPAGPAPAETGEKDPAQKLKEMEDKYLRTYADLENFRKRAAKEKEDLVVHNSEKLLRELLEVKDHLELALSHSHELPETKGLREGVNLTLKQLVKFLEKFDVKEVHALGEPFDPAFHEAIHQEESAEYKPGTVVHVYQKGYLFRERLLRAARVTVAAAKSHPPRGGGNP